MTQSQKNKNQIINQDQWQQIQSIVKVEQDQDQEIEIVDHAIKIDQDGIIMIETIIIDTIIIDTIIIDIDIIVHLSIKKDLIENEVDLDHHKYLCRFEFEKIVCFLVLLIQI